MDGPQKQQSPEYGRHKRVGNIFKSTSCLQNSIMWRIRYITIQQTPFYRCSAKIVRPTLLKPHQLALNLTFVDLGPIKDGVNSLLFIEENYDDRRKTLGNFVTEKSSTSLQIWIIEIHQNNLLLSTIQDVNRTFTKSLSSCTSCDKHCTKILFDDNISFV